MNRGRSSIADRPPRRHADDEPMGTVPPLAGISDYPAAARDGVSVDETVTMLRRLARIERRTLLVLAAHVGAVPEWEVKCALSLHLWQDAEHCGWLRERVPELRKPPHYLDRPDDPALEAFFEELVRSRTTRELLTGVYRVLKPSLLEAVDAHRRRANPLADQPTFRLLRFLALEEQEQLDWGAAALAALGGPDEEWERHLRAYLDAAGGAGGSGVRAEELPAPRAAEPLELVRVPRRDERFPRLWDSRGRIPYDERPHDEVNWRMLYVRLTEMHAVELVALTLFEWPDAELRRPPGPRPPSLGRGTPHDVRRGVVRDPRRRLAVGAARPQLRLVSQHRARAARALHAALCRRADGDAQNRQAGSVRGGRRVGRRPRDAVPGLRLGGRGPCTSTSRGACC